MHSAVFVTVRLSHISPWFCCAFMMALHSSRNKFLQCLTGEFVETIFPARCLISSAVTQRHCQKSRNLPLLNWLFAPSEKKEILSIAGCFNFYGFNDFSGGYNGCEYPSANCEQCDLFIYLALRQHVLCTKVHPYNIMSSWSDNSNNIVNKWNKVNSKYLL